MNKILLFVLVVGCTTIDTPVWPASFVIDFVEKTSRSDKFTTGRIQYSEEKNMSRVDRLNGQVDRFCGTVLPDTVTPCSHLVRDGKRYIVYPKERLCCICCTGEKGCGIMRRDWLNNATYEGTETLYDVEFNKWSKPDGDANDYYWETTDEQRIPRRLDEGTSTEKNFIMNTYQVRQIPDEVFHLPPFCEDAKYCPPSSNCGKFQLQQS